MTILYQIENHTVAMKTDFEIAQLVVIRPIVEIAEMLGINPDELEWSLEKKMENIASSMCGADHVEYYVLPFFV